MIKESYVSFELVQKLKEKGFDEPTLNTYQQFDDGVVDMLFIEI